MGAHDTYRSGKYMIWTDGTAYRCTAANGTNFSLADYAADWETATGA